MKSKNTEEPEQVAKPWLVADLLKLPASDEEWIIKGLLKKDSQMLLAAPPKSGKSLLAGQIALALSLPLGGKPRYLFDVESPDVSGHRGFEIKAPPDGKAAYKVLFFSLEMRPPEIGFRLQKQLGHFRIHAARLEGDAPIPDFLKFDLVHFFGFEQKAKKGSARELRQDLAVVKYTQKFGEAPDFDEDVSDAAAVRSIITKEAPDVVIFDTLIQLHGVNENDNILMKEVMRAIRRIAVIDADHQQDRHQAVPVAHIILHHTRKESGSYRAPLSPEIMRGAGAIHGVADLVMLARKIEREGVDNELEVNVSSRSSSIPNFLLLRNDKTLCYSWHEQPKPKEAEKPEYDTAKAEAILEGLKRQLEGVAEPGVKLNPQLIVFALKEAAAKTGLKRLAKIGPNAIGGHIWELKQKNVLQIRMPEQSAKRKKFDFKQDTVWLADSGGPGFNPHPPPLQPCSE